MLNTKKKIHNFTRIKFEIPVVLIQYETLYNLPLVLRKKDFSLTVYYPVRSNRLRPKIFKSAITPVEFQLTPISTLPYLTSAFLNRISVRFYEKIKKKSQDFPGQGRIHVFNCL